MDITTLIMFYIIGAYLALLMGITVLSFNNPVPKDVFSPLFKTITEERMRRKQLKISKLIEWLLIPITFFSWISVLIMLIYTLVILIKNRIDR